MRYENTVYRPPSEANSLIIQATIGCSHNKCIFCSMYKDRQFRSRQLNEILEDIELAKNKYRNIKKIFLADADALVLPSEHLNLILDKIKEVFPQCERVSSYATPMNILNKSIQELNILKEKGLSLLYIGIESGDDEILKTIDKGVTSEQILQATLKVQEAKIKLSVTMISGLGGPRKSASHAINCAKLVNRMKPEYLSFLTLMLEKNTILYEKYTNSEFDLLDPRAIMLELRLFIQNTNLDNTIFRANHASNYISLAGTLGKDKQRLLSEIDEALKENDFKPDYLRGL